MNKINFNLGENPTIIIEDVLGKLTIKGWDSTDINCESNNREMMDIEDKGDHLILSSAGNCSLRVPLTSEIKIKSVKGNLEINHLSGSIEADEVMGTANVFNSNSFKAKVIKGNLNITHLDEALEITKIYGNLSLKDVFGKATVENCSGNISVSGISGGFDLKTSGNTIFNFDPDPGKEYRVSSFGNLFCQVPSSAGFEAELQSTSGIQINAPVIEIEEKGPDSKFIQIGDGESKFFFKANGKITLSVEGHYGKFSSHKQSSHFNDLKEFSNQVATEAIETLERSLEDLNVHLQELTITIPEDKLNLKNTRKEILKARRDLEQQLAASRRQVRRSIKRKLSGPEIIIKKRSDDPVSNEERVKILQMVESGLISVEDAESLLAAIEGTEVDSAN